MQPFSGQQQYLPTIWGLVTDVDGRAKEIPETYCTFAARPYAAPEPPAPPALPQKLKLYMRRGLAAGPPGVNGIFRPMGL